MTQIKDSQKKNEAKLEQIRKELKKIKQKKLQVT